LFDTYYSLNCWCSCDVDYLTRKNNEEGTRQ